MEAQDNVFMLALKKADEQIGLIDGEHSSLRLQLERLVTEKTILLTTRRALLIQIGELPPEAQPMPQRTSTSRKPFKGLSLAAAARKYLFDTGRPQTHAELVEALLKGNVKIASKHPANSIRTSMQKHPDWFRWNKPPGDRGRWELVEWPIHPDVNPTVPPSEGTPNLTLVQ
jgi:hypothetical protein